MVSEYGRGSTKMAAVTRLPAMTTSARPKSAWASPDGWAIGANNSARDCFHARTMLAQPA